MSSTTAGAIALGLYVTYIVWAFGVRTVLQYRRTGSTGFHGVSGRPGTVEWWAGVLFGIALVLGLLAPAAQWSALVTPVPVLDHTALQLIGTALVATGFAATVVAQLGMGASWRIGVDEGERTALVTTGTFALVRNPVFTAMISGATGLTLLAPNLVAIIGLVALITAVELQVRVVEEPYLLRAHGETYRAYTARVGRFLPAIGRLTTDVL